MNKWAVVLLPILAFAATPPTFAARGKRSTTWDIGSVYVYSKLIRAGDTEDQDTAAWVTYALREVLGWKVVSRMQDADAVAILVPHGEGYEPDSSEFCKSDEAGARCVSNNGSGVEVSCIGGDCWSDAFSGHYLSILIALPIGNRATRQVKVVWNSNVARNQGAFGRYREGVEAAGTVIEGPHQSGLAPTSEDSLETLCRSAGIGSRWKCASMVRHSRKTWNKTNRRSGTVMTLP
jgi:hypothetical protein